MKKIVIIGTVHGDFTPEDELKEVLEEYNPDQLFVEIAAEDIKDGKLAHYPSEMLFAYEWARKNKVRVDGFDSKINGPEEGREKEGEQKLIEEQRKLLNKFSWKEMNKPENLRKFYDSFPKNLVDPKKEEKREFEMLKNIRNHMIKNGRVLIITGCAHLDFFEKNFENAEFPLRYHTKNTYFIPLKNNSSSKTFK